MISNILRGLVYFVVFVLLQILVLNHIHFLRIATPFLYLYFIVKLPVGLAPTKVIFLSFLTGLVIDMFGYTPGMHAAACTLVGFLRASLIELFSGKEIPEAMFPSYRILGYGGFIRYMLSFVFIHHIALFLLESLTLFDPLFLLIRIVASGLMTSLLMGFVEAFNLESQKSEE